MASFRKQMFFICGLKAISTFASSVMFISLALFLRDQFHINQINATEITGTYLALFYALPLLLGYLGSRYLNLKTCYIVGMLMQVFGYGIFALADTLPVLYLALAFIVVGSAINSICILEFIGHMTQGKEESKRLSMLFYYGSMNVGFVLGGTFSGFVSLSHHFALLILILSCLPLSCAIVAFFKVHYQPHFKKTGSRSLFITLLAFFLMIFFSFILFIYSHQAKFFLLSLVGFALVLALFYVYKRALSEEKKQLHWFLFYFLIWIFYWTIYLLMPTMFMYFIQDWVSLDWHGFSIPAQWLENLDAILIVTLTPVLAYLFKKIPSLIKNRFQTDIFFGLSILCIVLTSGMMIFLMHFFTGSGKISLNYMLLYIALLSIGELFIASEGYSLPMKLGPMASRSLLNGVWVASMSISALFSSSLSHYFFSQNSIQEINSYKLAFHEIFIFSSILFILILLTFLIKKNNRINYNI